jgi:hypothetical protein
LYWNWLRLVRSSKDKAVWLFLSPNQNIYYRCVGEGFLDCDQHTPRVSDSGSYKLFELPGRPAFVKVGEDLSATEVVTIMDTVLIKRGKCEGASPIVRTQLANHGQQDHHGSELEQDALFEIEGPDEDGCVWICIEQAATRQFKRFPHEGA